MHLVNVLNYVLKNAPKIEIQKHLNTRGLIIILILKTEIQPANITAEQLIQTQERSHYNLQNKIQLNPFFNNGIILIKN